MLRRDLFEVAGEESTRFAGAGIALVQKTIGASMNADAAGGMGLEDGAYLAATDRSGPLLAGSDSVCGL
jgi:hypothetical protein